MRELGIDVGLMSLFGLVGVVGELGIVREVDADEQVNVKKLGDDCEWVS